MGREDGLGRVEKKVQVARVLSFIVAASWSYGLVYYMALFGVSLFITPWMLGDVLVVTSLPYLAAFFVPVVPSFLVFRHLGSMAYAIRSENVKLLKELDSRGWAWVELVFGLVIPLFMLYVVGMPAYTLDALTGFLIPRLIPITLKGEMTVGGAFVSLPTAYALQRIHADVVSLRAPRSHGWFG